MSDSFRIAMRSPGIAIALVLSLLISASAVVIWQEYIRTTDRGRQTTTLIVDTNELMAAVLEAQSSARGYLLSRDPALLGHFQRAIDIAYGRMHLLFRRPRDFNGQEATFRDLEKQIESELAGLRRAVERPGFSAAALQADEASTNRLRALHLQLQENARASLSLNRGRSRFLARLSEAIATLGCAGIFAIVLLSQIRIQRLAASQVRLNQELTAANEDLRQFVYSASHDLQEPLRVLMLYSDLIDINIKAQRPVSDALGHLRRAARHMSALLVDLLSYTQVISGPRNVNASADLAQEVRNAIESLEATVLETGAEVQVGDLPVVPMESAHAQLLLQNLIGNSLKYRRDGHAPHVNVSAEKDPDKWVISVTDDGIGVAPEYHQQIFGIFKRLHTRTAYPGTGLGLAICRKIVERYGGTIWVESNAGSGSTFRFSVPDGFRSWLSGR